MASRTCWRLAASRCAKCARPAATSACWPDGCSTGYNSSQEAFAGCFSFRPRFCWSLRRCCCRCWTLSTATVISRSAISARRANAPNACKNDCRIRTTLDGVIVIDKPEGWPSQDVVNKVRRIAQTKKVGHLGTLDPIATGVLPLVIERATRLAQFYTHSDKIYEGVVRFGWSTSSYDRAGEDTSGRVEVHLTAAAVQAALRPLLGEFAQRPPAGVGRKVGSPLPHHVTRNNVVAELST